MADAILALLALMSIGACGRYDNRTLYQPSIPEQFRTNLGRYSESNGYLSIEPAAGVHFQFSADGVVNQPPKFRLTIYLDQGYSVRWTASKAYVTDVAGARQYSLSIGKWGFLNSCRVTPRRTCSLSDTDLIDGTVDKTVFRIEGGDFQRRENIRFLTDATNRIKGARLTDTRGITAGKEKWLSVSVPITVDGLHDDLREGVLVFPPLEINQQKLTVPPISIRQEQQTIYSPTMFF